MKNNEKYKIIYICGTVSNSEESTENGSL